MIAVSRKKIAQRIVAVLQRASAAQVMQATALVLKRQRRTADADLLLRDVGDARIQYAKHLEARVVSARPLTASVRQHLTTWLQRYYSVTTVTCHYVLDTAVLGGVRIETPRHRFQFSVADRLTTLKDHA